MIDRDDTDSGWVSTVLALVCPVTAVTVGALGEASALAGLLWTLGAACPIAWIIVERRVARQEARILAAVDDREGETAHAERQ
jgi:hypothetical protein